MAGEDPPRVTWIRTLRCLARGPTSIGVGCFGPVEAHHAGRRGMGRKAHDDTAVPLCLAHHRALHDNAGVFKGWSKAQLRAWAEAAIAATQAGWVQHQRLQDVVEF